MQVDDFSAASGLVEAIDILCDQPRQSARALQLCNCPVGRVWFCAGDVPPPDNTPGPVPLPASNVGDKFLVLNGVAPLPASIVIPVGRYTGTQTYACTGKNPDIPASRDEVR